MAESPAFPVRSANLSGAAPAGLSSSLRHPHKAISWALPHQSQLWSRLVVLGAGLAAIKLVLLASQGQTLYEAHWRIAGAAGSWLNYFGFYAFVLLGGLSIVQLGKCQWNVSRGGLRVVNGVVVLLGLSFIFLTLHNGDKNYLFPALSGVLKWTSVVPYVANALFFNQPFLAAWVFVYVAVYYCLTRTGREKWCLWLPGIFGCAYALIFLRELMLRRDELLVVDAVGLVSLVAAWRADRKAGPRSQRRLAANWLIIPVMWSGFFLWAMLRFDNQWHSTPASYFLGLIALVLALFAAASGLIQRYANLVAWSWFLPFFFASFLLLTDTNYPVSENYNHALCLGLTLPRYFIGEMIVIAGLGLLGLLYGRLRPTGSLWWLDVLCLLALVLSAIDLRLTQIMGVRLGCDVLSFGDSPKMMWKLATPYLPGLITGLVVAGALYVLAVRALQLWSERQQKTADRNDRTKRLPAMTSTTVAATYVAVLFVLLGVVGLGFAESDKAEGQAVGRLVLSSPLWKRVTNRILTREDFLKTAQSLGLGDLGAATPVATGKSARDLNVLVVFMESSYNKHLSLFGSSEETQPLLSQYKDRMELFPNFFSAFAGSIHARFATFTSLYPVSDFHAFTQERVPVKSFFEVLHDHGYSCSMFYSSYFDYTGFRDFLKNRGLDEMYDADTMPGQRGTERVEWGLLEEETLGAIRGQLQKYAQNHRRFCLTYVPAAPHYPYDKIPQRFQKYKMKEVGDFTPLYLNELLYMDWVLASIVDELKQTGLLENTLVVITNDHGEMLGGKEDEHIGHGWAMSPELANTPLIVMDPVNPGYHLNKTIGTQVDFLPTILGRLNIPLPTDQLYEGRSLDEPSSGPRLGYLNSFKQFGIVDRDKILLGDRESNNPAGAASKGAVFVIGNDGAKTVFTEAQESGGLSDRVEAMARFDAFQQSLLRNYASYCASVHQSASQVARR